MSIKFIVPAILPLFLSLMNFSSPARRDKLITGPEKDIFGHPRKHLPCLVKKSIVVESGKTTEQSLTYDAAGRLLMIQEKAGNKMETLGKLAYDKDGLLVSVEGALNPYGFKFFYGADKRLEKVTFKPDPEKEIETVNFSYSGDSIVQASRLHNTMVGNEYICTYKFDKDYNLVKATGSAKRNIDEATADELTFDFYPDTYNFALSMGDYRFFTLFLCMQGFFGEGPYFLASTNMARKQNYIDYNQNQIKVEPRSFEIVINKKNNYNFPTSIQTVFHNGQPSYTTELTYVQNH